MDPSIMKLLEDDEDESMHSGADVEALSAALNRDIGGDSSAFTQPNSDSDSGVLAQGSSSASKQLLGQWQTSSQDENNRQQIQQKEQLYVQSSEQHSSQVEPIHHESGAKVQDQQVGSQPDNGNLQLQQEHSNSDQQLQTKTNPPEVVEKVQAMNSEQVPFQFPKLDANQHSGTQQQHNYQQSNIQQETATSNEVNNQHSECQQQTAASNEANSQQSGSQQQHAYQKSNIQQQTAASNEKNIQHSGSQQQHAYQQSNTQQQTAASNEANSQHSGRQQQHAYQHSNIQQPTTALNEANSQHSGSQQLDTYQQSNIQQQSGTLNEATSQHSGTQQQHTYQQSNIQQQTAASNEANSQHSGSQQQHTYQQSNIQQQTETSNEANNSTKRMKASPSIPFQLLIPIIRPHLDKDRSMQLQAVFTKLKNNEVSKEDFLRVIRNIVGDQMLRQAVNKVHVQLQTQAARNQQTNPNQYSLQTQAASQQRLSRGSQQFTESQTFAPLHPMSSSQNQKSHITPSSQPHAPASSVQMQMDTNFPPFENSSQRSREIDNKSDVKGMHAAQMYSTNMNAVKPEREVSVTSLQAGNKQQQHTQLSQTPFSVYGGSSSNFHSHPYPRPPLSAAAAPLRSHSQDSLMKQAPYTQGTISAQMGSTQANNVIGTTKYEVQNIANETKRFHGGSLASHLTPQQNPLAWQPLANKEQRGAALSSMAHVKQEVVDQAAEPPLKSQLTTREGSFGLGRIDQGNTTFGSMNDEEKEKRSSSLGFPSSVNAIGSHISSAATTQLDSNMQISSASSSLLAGNTSKTPIKKASVGQKKPFEAVTGSSPLSSKKQKTSGAFLDQSIEHLNDVTAVSGVNLREEEEQLFSAPKEDSRASEATRRVVQEEEERLLLQKGPLQKKLADIMFKCGLKGIGKDVERCLSLCAEERLRGFISSMIRLSKQRVDTEKPRHRYVITSDVGRQILAMNRKAKEEWDKKQAEEAEKLRKVNEAEGDTGADADKDKEEGRSKATKVNKEEDDKMRATAANVAARAAVGGDDMLSKWQQMAEQARQKREGLDGPSSSQSGKATGHKPSSSFRRSLKEQETERRGPSSSLSGGNRKFGRSAAVTPQPRVARNISLKDVAAVLERESQMMKSMLLYRLYEKIESDPVVD